ncbi:MAG: SGNH/GDSL hydrolase family protein [Maribacter sp.]|nr:SGNH/GDSL hydrolase family protein [Maribacter sp.]
MILHIRSLVLVIILVFSGLETFSQKDSLSYLALGDSYTIGTSENPAYSWPQQLVEKLAKKGTLVKGPKIVAGAGWTTEKLLLELQSANLNGEYDLVSLLIGVNNQYRGLDINQFRKQFLVLLEKSILFAGNDASKVFVVSIPDWGVMPFAKLKDTKKITREIGKYNAIIKAEVEKRNVLYIDITKLSRQAVVDKTLIASDSLHPSKKMYKSWVKKISKTLVKNLN